MAYNIIPQRGVFSTIANLINENFQRIYQQILGLDGSGEQAAEDISQLESDVSALQAGKANDSDVVHKAGAETITGNKTFTGTVKLPLQNSGILVTDENGVVQSDSNTYAGAQTSGGAANKAVSIPFGQVDSTSTSTAFTATVDGITELRDGVCVYLKNGVVTSAANCTLNVNGLGAKRILYTMAAASAVTTQWNINYTMLFIYNSTRMEGGCWDMYYGYYSDSNSIGYQLRTHNNKMPVSDTSRYYKLFFTSADNTKLVPSSVDSTNNATSARPVNQRPINPFGAIRYNTSNASFAADVIIDPGYLWLQYNVTLGYSFNRTDAALTLTIGKPVFIKCAPQDDGSAIIDANTPYVQDLPTTEDGKIYIFLGVAYSATQVEMQMVHPVYYYKNGAINLWTGTGTQTDVFKPTESNVIDVAEYNLMKINEVKGKSLVMNQRAKNPNPSTTNNTEWRAYNNSNVSIEYVEDGVKATILNEGVGYSRGLVANCTGIANTHKILAVITIKPSVTHDFNFETGNASSTITSCAANQWTKFAGIVTSSKNDTQLIVKPVISNLSVNDTFTVRFASCIDLTQMFGAGNEPTTVEEVEAIFGNDYYEYNTGEVVGNNVEKLDVTGFNIWDGEYTEVDSRYIAVNGTITASTNYRVSSYIPVLPNTQYYLKDVVASAAAAPAVCWYDSEKNFISGLNGASNIYNKVVTSPNNAAFLRCSIFKETADTACINKSNTSKNGTYEPYKHSEFPLNLTELTGKVNGEGTSVTIFPDGLHGVGTAYDSLIVDEDGYARRAIKRMAKVDIGTFIWNTTSTESRFYASLPADATVYTAINNVFKNTYSCDKYTKSTTLTGMTDKTTFLGNKSYMYAQDSSYSTAADFKTAMDGVMLYYELATPIEYVLDTPVQCVAKVYPNGTVNQVPVMPDSTPMVMDVTYLHDNGGMIGGLMNRLASLEPRIDDLAKGIKTISVQYGDATNIILETEKINGNEGTVSIPAATSQAAGAMSAAQAALLEDLSDLADDIETLLASI